MNSTNNRLPWILVTFLVALNVLVLTMVWFKSPPSPPGPPHPPGGPMHGGLAKEIGMSQTEAEKIKPLQDAHFAKLDAFQGEIVQLRQEALSEFGKVDADSGAAMAAFDKIGAVQVAMEKERYRHFYEILALCTPEEAQKFQEIMPRLLERRNQPENRPMRPPL